jgi:hypothetical protein
MKNKQTNVISRWLTAALIAAIASLVSCKDAGGDNGTTVSVTGAGEHWTEVWTRAEDSIFGDNRIMAVAYGNGKFVAGGDSGIMAYSYDGINWTKVPNSTFEHVINPNLPTGISEIVYGNGKFVAGGSTGFNSGDYHTAYSSDGINWTKVDNILNCGIDAIAWGGDKFVAFGSDDTWCPRAAYSSDGVTWTYLDKGIFSSGGINDLTTPNAIAYGNGKFVAMSGGGAYFNHDMDEAAIAYSLDGINWTNAAASKLPSDLGGGGIVFGNGKFIAYNYGRGDMVYSLDGINWTKANYPFFGDFFLFTMGYGGGRFVVSANRDIGDGTVVVSYSSDGITWKLSDLIDYSLLPNTYIFTFAYGGGKFVGVGSEYDDGRSGQIWYSAD